jgi:hypothetical protein
MLIVLFEYEKENEIKYWWNKWHDWQDLLSTSLRENAKSTEDEIFNIGTFSSLSYLPSVISLHPGNPECETSAAQFGLEVAVESMFSIPHCHISQTILLWIRLTDE